MNIRPIIPIVLALLCATAALAQDSPSAFIADVKGKVRFQKPQAAWQDARIMTTLPAGSKLDLPNGSSVTLSFVKGGARKQVTGPATATVTASGVEGTSNVVDRTPGARAAVLMPNNVNIQQMGGMRSRAGARGLRITSDEVTSDVRPTFTWTAEQPYDRFDVIVYDTADDATVYKATFGGDKHQITLPKTTCLQYGHTYTVQLTGYQEGSRTQAEEFTLDVLDEAAAKKVTEARQAADEQFKAAPEDVTPLVLLMTVYSDNSLYTPALEVAQQIALLRPEDTNLYLIMGKLYEARRETDKADAMFRKAGVTP